MDIQDQIKQIILDVLPELECVIGWSYGPTPLSSRPLFVRKPADVDELSIGPLSIQNLSVFLPEFKGKKVGIVAKGCDSRSINQLLTEKLIKREDVIIIGYPCEGVLDLGKIGTMLDEFGDAGEAASMEIEGVQVRVNMNGTEHSYAFEELKADKCSRCNYPNALQHDHFAGIAIQADQKPDEYADLATLESMSYPERMAFWEKEMSRCIRCYACRNACPLCVCRGQCVATSREPHWLSQADSTRDKMMFQMIHAIHMAGRCTGCGECQRACPVGIPIMLLKRSLGKGVEELFGYKAGVDPEATPPLLTFKVEEDHIKEREW